VGNPGKKRIPKTLGKRNTEPLPKYKNYVKCKHEKERRNNKSRCKTKL
jgi:hypothetical protein